MHRIWNKHKSSLDKARGKNTPPKPKVFVGLSGGVDSSVAAYLLKRQGYETIGVHLRCWNVEGCDDREAEDARRVAEAIGIPFYVFNLEKEYKERVVDYMIEGYRLGITPNPDVMCNKEIKFGLFLEKALASGADYVATGHYVKIQTSKFSAKSGSLPAAGKSQNGDSKPEVVYKLFQAKDRNKDQSYFLWTLGQEQLKHCLFPIGGYLKSEVRAIARRAGLPTAEKKDSQGICFLGKITLKDFLSAYLPESEGKILTPAGEVIGSHRGYQYYTIGQRRGFGLAHGKPYYVAEKNATRNTLVVAEGDENPLLYRKEIAIGGANFIGRGPNSRSNHKVLARLRYRQPLSEAGLFQSGEDLFKLSFKKPQKFVAPGQSAVFYSPRGEMLGGGVITG
ncbi:MAG TPA: tRNA 2-thiouridine(34) synthase MnmA [Candidatus Tyrphobacter sp.]|nr:tRNA 2-thiouridine(34) synthase MnmA [Candidatus Tyrphobacter sp.]